MFAKRNKTIIKHTRSAEISGHISCLLTCDEMTEKKNLQKTELYWHAKINVFKMSPTKHRNRLLSSFVIFVYLTLLCHYTLPVEGKSSPQLPTDADGSDLSDLFSEKISLSPQFRKIAEIDENEEYYYYEDDDPYGLMNGEENESTSKVDYTDEDYYDDYDNATGANLAAKSGKLIVI